HQHARLLHLAPPGGRGYGTAEVAEEPEREPGGRSELFSPLRSSAPPLCPLRFRTLVPRRLRYSWKCKAERASLALDALRPDLSPVRLDDLLADGQTQAGARRAVLDPGRAVEALEQVAQLLRRQAGAAVPDGEGDEAAVRLGRDVDGRPLRGVLGRVLDQIAQDPLDVARVG